MILKRAFDIVGSLIGLFVFGPLMGLIAVAILVLDGRPLLYRQTRIGRRRRPFRIFKFRTMAGGEQVTRTGRWLRATGLDELPQFLNIIAGDMSAVGPRPLMTADVARLGWTDRHDWRWAVRPGLTGLTQLYRARTDDESLPFDRLYLGKRSQCFDLWVIAVTILMNAFGKTRIRRRLPAPRKKSES